MRARKEAADAQMTALIEAEEAKKASRDQCRVLHSSCTQLDPYRAAPPNGVEQHFKSFRPRTQALL